MLLPRGRCGLSRSSGSRCSASATAGLACALVGDDDLELALHRARGARARRRRRRRRRRSARSRSCATRRSFPSRCSRSRRSGSPSSSARRRRSSSSRSTSSSRRRCSRSRTACCAESSRPTPPLLLALPLAAFVAFTAPLVPLDVGRAGGRDRARVLRLPVHRRPRRRRARAARRLAAAGAARRRSSRSARSSRPSGSGRRRRGRSSSRATSRSRTRTRPSSASPRSSRTRACTAATSSSRSRSSSSRSCSAADGRRAGSPRRRSPPFLFWGLFYSYSQSSFVALFVVTFAVALVGVGRRLRIVLLACALVATLAAGARRGGVGERALGEGRDERPLAARRRDARRVPGEAHRGRRRRRAAAGERRGVGPRLAEPERVAHDAAHRARRARRPRLRALPWVLAAAALGALPRLAARPDAWRSGSAAVFLVLVVHSLLYAGFFEDPLTWGVFGLTAAGIASATAVESPSRAHGGCTNAPQLLAH